VSSVKVSDQGGKSYPEVIDYHPEKKVRILGFFGKQTERLG
jgi:hypothetical protein